MQVTTTVTERVHVVTTTPYVNIKDPHHTDDHIVEIFEGNDEEGSGMMKRDRDQGMIGIQMMKIMIIEKGQVVLEKTLLMIMAITTMLLVATLVHYLKKKWSESGNLFSKYILKF